MILNLKPFWAKLMQSNPRSNSPSSNFSQKELNKSTAQLFLNGESVIHCLSKQNSRATSKPIIGSSLTTVMDTCSRSQKKRLSNSPKLVKNQRRIMVSVSMDTMYIYKRNSITFNHFGPWDCLILFQMSRQFQMRKVSFCRTRSIPLKNLSIQKLGMKFPGVLR